jgi:hypothetical protein
MEGASMKRRASVVVLVVLAVAALTGCKVSGDSKSSPNVTPATANDPLGLNPAYNKVGNNLP